MPCALSGPTRRRWWWVFLPAAVFGLLPATVHAGFPFPFWGGWHGAADPLDRVGNPQNVAPWAKLTYTPKCYSGYYVGGGAPWYGPASHFKGEPRYPLEGTWGVDYDPWYSRVRLQWYHGTRFQGGRGQYEPDEKNNPFEHFLHN